MGSSLPTAQCSPGRTGGDRASRKRRHPQRRDRWGSSTLSPRPYWLVAAGWGEPTTRSCSPSLAPHTAEGREAMVTRCPREQRGGRNAQAPREGHPPGSPSPIARPMAAPGDVSPHSSPPLLQARPAVPGCPSQAGPGKHRRWLRDGHRELPTAAPKAPPSTGRSLAPPSTPRRHARQESRHEPGWPRLCRRPRISSEGREVTVHRSLMTQSTAR